jgi:flagellar motor protein MotB
MALRFDREPNYWPVFTDVVMGSIFIFLILIITFSEQIKTQKVTKAIETRKFTLISKLDSLKMTKYSSLKSSFSIDTLDSGIRLYFDQNILFDDAKYHLKSSDNTAVTLITDISKLLKRHNELKSSIFHEIIIEGHTNSKPFSGEFGNWGLSAARSNTILKIMKDYIEPKRLSPRGYADTRPREYNMAKQRRIELLINFDRDSVKIEIEKVIPTL